MKPVFSYTHQVNIQTSCSLIHEQVPPQLKLRRNHNQSVLIFKRFATAQQADLHFSASFTAIAVKPYNKGMKEGNSNFN